MDKEKDHGKRRTIEKGFMIFIGKRVLATLVVRNQGLSISKTRYDNVVAVDVVMIDHISAIKVSQRVSFDSDVPHEESSQAKILCASEELHRQYEQAKIDTALEIEDASEGK